MGFVPICAQILDIRVFDEIILLFVTSILPSQRGTIGSPRCLVCIFRFVRSHLDVWSVFFVLFVRGNRSIVDFMGVICSREQFN